MRRVQPDDHEPTTNLDGSPRIHLQSFDCGSFGRRDPQSSPSPRPLEADRSIRSDPKRGPPLADTDADSREPRSVPQLRKRCRELLERDQRLHLLQRPFLNRFDQRQQLLVFGDGQRLFLIEHSLQLALQRSRQLILSHLAQSDFTLSAPSVGRQMKELRQQSPWSCLFSKPLNPRSISTPRSLFVNSRMILAFSLTRLERFDKRLRIEAGIARCGAQRVGQIRCGASDLAGFSAVA